MRIACAQFSPQVGDIDNNLNRADAVLNKAKPEQLENLDLLVLPELAFTGMSIVQGAVTLGSHEVFTLQRAQRLRGLVPSNTAGTAPGLQTNPPAC